MKTKLTRQQLALIAVLLIAFALLKAGLIWWYLGHKNQPAAAVTVSCQNLQAGCTLPDGSVLTLDRQPQAAQPFGLSLQRLNGSAPAIEFSMRDMDMGFNRYKLLPQGDGWRASIILPVCVTGSHQWQMALKYPDKSYLIDFSTR
ncbi:hypothetical protein [Vogesella oryzae]|uniref:hypothetical protein n=1 Tax=Vogesella oryzae TaxID=1735285 RepID=UPI001583FBA5|nr:hypothetical protein [Vogesella oryzae]